MPWPAPCVRVLVCSATEPPTDCSLLQGGASASGPGAGEAVVATMREKYGCPENRASLGRAGWSVLHSMAATYPEKPTQTQQSEMHQFISVCMSRVPSCHATALRATHATQPTSPIHIGTCIPAFSTSQTMPAHQCCATLSSATGASLQHFVHVCSPRTKSCRTHFGFLIVPCAFISVCAMSCQSMHAYNNLIVRGADALDCLTRVCVSLY
jgi:hypothetical protein